MTSKFHLTAPSLRRLDTVHKDLQVVVLRAHQIMTDSHHVHRLSFQITEGVRTVERQKELVARGASKTMNSRHMAHPTDGLSRAVDLVAIEDDGDVSWHMQDYFTIAEAMRLAALDCMIPIRWGNGWFVLNEVDNLQAAQLNYIERKRAKKEKPFLDGPHFELPTSHS